MFTFSVCLMTAALVISTEFILLDMLLITLFLPENKHVIL